MSNSTQAHPASNQTELPDHEFQVLQHIAQANHVRQRDLAQIVGVSLGMTNAILKRLARKGLITIRKVNNRNIMYAVSSAGLEQIARRSYRYLKRTIKNVVVYRETIESLVGLIAEQGFKEIDLVEQSDLDFIVEHACEDAEVAYRRLAADASRTPARSATTAAAPGTPADAAANCESHGPDGHAFLLHSEQLEPPAGRRSLKELEGAIVNGAREAYLSEVLI